MASARQLPGYEHDINHLIDAYAILAHQEQVLSFQTFKQLFQEGCYAYIHQAYWGCEHSPEYAQLLFAVALDRLDIPSPTAQPDSSLWQLHRLQPAGSLQLATMLPPISSQLDPMESTMQPMSQPAAAAEHGVRATAGSLEAMQVDQAQFLVSNSGGSQLPGQGPAAMHVDGLDHWPPQQQEQQQQQQQQQQHMQQQLLEHSALPVPYQTVLLQQQQEQQEEQQQQQQPPWELVEPQSMGCTDPGAPPGAAADTCQQPAYLAAVQAAEEQGQHHAPIEQQPAVSPQMHSQQQPQHPNSEPCSNLWFSSPLLLPQAAPLHGQPHPVTLSPSDDVWQLLSPPPQQGMGSAARPGYEGLEGFMLPSAAIPAQLQGYQQQPLQPQQDPGHAVSPIKVQQHQQQYQQPPLHASDEDDFMSDLLAILDEAMPMPDEAAAGSTGVQGAAASLQPGFVQQQQQQQPVLQIPLVVKAAAVFTLLALHESQLNYPKVPVYVPLALLQQLAVCAAEFRAAGAAAADALQALQVLTSQQRMLLGQFRRPNHWEPQLPWSLMPGGRLPGGLGANTAIGVAARKAARTAAKSAMQSAAVAAAARAARSAFDPGVHREALFHIKTALRGLSNFRSLQSLCDQYADARKAVFEPLLVSGTHQAQAAAAGQPQHTAAAQTQVQEPREPRPGAAEAAHEPLVVKRGGSRRKRKAAASAAGAAASVNTRSSSAAPVQDTAGSGLCNPPAGSSQQAAADGADVGAQAVGNSAELPELFDTSFATSLQGLANSEASRMLLLLDPYYSANKVRQRTAEEKRAAKAAEAAAAAEARGRLERFKSLTMGRSAADNQHGSARGQQRSRPSASSQVVQHLKQELVTAGIFTEHELEQVAASLGPGVDSGVSGGVQQALRRAAQQREAAVQVAEEWLRAQGTLVVVDVDEDMP